METRVVVYNAAETFAEVLYIHFLCLGSLSIINTDVNVMRSNFISTTAMQCISYSCYYGNMIVMSNARIKVMISAHAHAFARGFGHMDLINH